MLRGMPGGGSEGGGNIPNILNNPMMRQIAEQLTANGGVERLMQNPTVADMMNRMQSGGGMPSMAELMSDPSLRELAKQFGAGGASGGP